MARLIDATRIEQYILNNCSDNEEINAIYGEIINAPTIEAEPTLEQIEEYCRTRCLVVVDSALFNEMKSRWSAEPTKHGRWIRITKGCKGIYICNQCHRKIEYDELPALITQYYPYCHCGAKMDEVEE